MSTKVFKLATLLAATGALAAALAAYPAHAADSGAMSGGAMTHSVAMAGGDNMAHDSGMKPHDNQKMMKDGDCASKNGAKAMEQQGASGGGGMMSQEHGKMGN